VFLDKARRRDMYQRLAIIVGHNSPDPLTPGLLLSPILGKALSAKMLLPSPTDELSTAQRKWQAREISNVRFFSPLCDQHVDFSISLLI
jgi:3-hydroxymyristoyl/3-hydroxydecanoyl-(acyl carrier protein) dehydratase